MTIRQNEEKAHKRMAVILQVESGLMTATEGAMTLGISRQALFEWQERAREAMLSSLADRCQAGRPAEARDEEEERLARELAQTKAELEEAITALDIKRTLEELRKDREVSVTSGAAGKIKHQSKSRGAEALSEILDAICSRRGTALRRACIESSISYSSARRWKARRKCGDHPLGAGPVPESRPQRPWQCLKPTARSKRTEAGAAREPMCYKGNIRARYRGAISMKK